jgi:hypothetical protein
MKCLSQILLEERKERNVLEDEMFCGGTEKNIVRKVNYIIVEEVYYFLFTSFEMYQLGF